MAAIDVEARKAQDRRAREIAESVLRNAELLAGVRDSMDDPSPPVSLNVIQAREAGKGQSKDV